MFCLKSKQNRGNHNILSPFLLLLVIEFIFTTEHIVEGGANAPTGEEVIEDHKGSGTSNDSEHSVITENVPIEADEEENAENVPIEGEEEKMLSRSPSSSSSKSSSNGSPKKEVPEPSDDQIEHNFLEEEEPSLVTEVAHNKEEQESQEIESEEFGENNIYEQSSQKTASPNFSPKKSPKKIDNSESSEELPLSSKFHLSDEESSPKKISNQEKEIEEMSPPPLSPLRIYTEENKRDLGKRTGLIIPKDKNVYVKAEKTSEDVGYKKARKAKSWPSNSPRKSEDFSPIKSSNEKEGALENKGLSASFSHDFRDKGIKEFNLSPKSTPVNSPNHPVVSEQISSPVHVSHHQKTSEFFNQIKTEKSEIEDDKGEKTHENPQTPPSSPVKDNQVVRKNSFKHAFNVVRAMSQSLFGKPFQWIGGKINAIKNNFNFKNIFKKKEIKNKKSITMNPIEGKEPRTIKDNKDHKHEKNGQEHGNRKSENEGERKGGIHKVEGTGHHHQHEEKAEKTGY
ncbi:hypothetical protein ACQ4LE_005485 [Meloidogyne hapla]|uniref:Uncharacterized protein n=1 Tax=Meloidogyne hapla TaxID=6305 RepID=A0A1I8B778_MELHA